jgi:hypothetical protein
MTVDMAGPTSLHRNDLALLRLSQINDRMAAMQEGEPDPLTFFEDSAYHIDTHCRSYFKVLERVPDYAKWNRDMKMVRISIKWNYGYTAECCSTSATRRS